MNMNNRTKLYTAVYVALGAAAFCGLTLPAAAGEQDPRTKTVKYDDLNIANPAGAKVLYRRIQAAAREVCPLAMDTLQTQFAAHACIDHAIDQAVRDVNVTALTELRFGTQLRLASK